MAIIDINYITIIIIWDRRTPTRDQVIISKGFFTPRKRKGEILMKNIHNGIRNWWENKKSVGLFEKTGYKWGNIRWGGTFDKVAKAFKCCP